MRPLPQGAPRRADARSARGADAHRGTRRSRAAARAAGLIGAIVAGGASSRFGGEAKGLREVGGRRIIDRVAGALRPVVDELVIVSNDPRAAEWLPGVTAVADVRSERGSIVGIHTALAHAAGDVLVVAWDMPFVTAELLAAIGERVRHASFAVAPEGTRGPEPFCAAYRPACVPYVEAAIVEGDMRAQRLLGRFPALEVIERDALSAFGDPGRLFFNVNSAADLAAAEALLGTG